MEGRMIAYCGIDCSKCLAYQATQENNTEKLKAVAEQWSEEFKADIEPEQAICDGCKAGKRKSAHCKNDCKIRVCCLKKAIDSCIECEKDPCKQEAFVLKNAPEAKANLESQHLRIV